MRIEGPNKTSQTDKAKSKDKDKQKTGDAAFQGMVSGSEAQQTSGGSMTGTINRVDALLAVQTAEDPTERAARRRMTDRGNKLLDLLDEMRMGILTDSVSEHHMHDISDVIATHRERIMDPELTQILDEIDLRAQIEIAKLEMAREIARSQSAR